MIIIFSEKICNINIYWIEREIEVSIINTFY